jgi:hypothetical protein
MNSPIVAKAYIDAVHAEHLREAKTHNLDPGARPAAAPARRVRRIRPRPGWLPALKDELARVVVGEPRPGQLHRSDWTPAENAGPEAWVGSPYAK